MTSFIGEKLIDFEQVQTERELRVQLAATYRILADLGLDDMTYTHLSARMKGDPHYFIFPLGLLYEEVTASNLLKVSLDGKVLEGREEAYNKTGYVIHGAIYKKRPEINAVIHCHTICGVAVSSMVCGLQMTSQFAMHFYDNLSYYDYDSLALDENKQGEDLARALDRNKALMLHNHGTLTCGTTIQEAFFYMYYLEQACKTQCVATQTGQELIVPSDATCRRARDDMRHFEKDLGRRDWNALYRKLLKKDQSFKE